MAEIHEGGCVCGSVRYRAVGAPARITICHCTWCQRRTGSAFGVAAVFQAEQIEATGSQPKIYRHVSDESGRWLDLHFCPNCGTNIGLTLEWVPGIFGVDGGTFDEPSWLDPERFDVRYVYRRSAQTWSSVPQGVELYEEHFRT
jgi:hypothetical protein